MRLWKTCKVKWERTGKRKQKNERNKWEKKKTKMKKPEVNLNIWIYSKDVRRAFTYFSFYAHLKYLHHHANYTDARSMLIRLYVSPHLFVLSTWGGGGGGHCSKSYEICWTKSLLYAKFFEGDIYVLLEVSYRRWLEIERKLMCRRVCLWYIEAISWL